MQLLGAFGHRPLLRFQSLKQKNYETSHITHPVTVSRGIWTISSFLYGSFRSEVRPFTGYQVRNRGSDFGRRLVAGSYETGRCCWILKAAQPFV